MAESWRLEALTDSASPLCFIVFLLSLWADQPAKEYKMVALGSHPSNPHRRPLEGPRVESSNHIR